MSPRAICPHVWLVVVSLTMTLSVCSGATAAAGQASACIPDKTDPAPQTTSALEGKIPAACYPQVPAQGNAVGDFVAPGWRVEAQTQGDLNQDGVADIALILHGTDRAKILRNEDLGESELDTNPRVLVVLWGRQGGGYTLALLNHKLIPRHINPMQDDVFDGTVEGGLEIERGSLRLGLGVFYNAGSWEMSNITLRFRWQQGQWQLIGYDRNTTRRNTGDTDALSINYLSAQAKRVQGRSDSDVEMVSWRRLQRQPLLTLEQIGDALEFEPLERLAEAPSRATEAAAAHALLTTPLPRWNWADDRDAAKLDPQFAKSQAICRSLRPLAPPAADAPDAKAAVTLKECDPVALYDGTGVAMNPMRARQCALLSLRMLDEARKPQELIDTLGVLTMVYANGRGVPRDLDLATALACRMPAAPAEVHERIMHLQERKEGLWPGDADFDFCDDNSGGITGTECALRKSAIAEAERADKIQMLMLGWNAQQRQVFATLEAAARAYAQASSEHEVDLSGGSHLDFQVEQEQSVQKAFINLLEKLEESRQENHRSLHAPTDDARVLDARLNALYRQIMSQSSTESANLDDRVTTAGIRTTQRAWLRYHDAWLAFAAVRYPKLDPDVLRALLLGERIGDLKGFAPQPHKP